MKNYYIMGIHSISEALKKFPERILCLYTVASTRGRKNTFLETVQKKRIPFRFVSKERLAQLVGSHSHQSFVAEMKPKKTPQLFSFIEQKETALILALDRISDPQNVGAIFRASECFGVDALLWSKNRGCPMTPVVSKTSSGASELVPYFIVSNLADTLKNLKKHGFEIVIADIGSEAVMFNEFSYAPKTVLVMGSEGKGIQPIIRKLADHIVKIPMKGSIDSLNVSQSAAVLLSRKVND